MRLFFSISSNRSIIDYMQFFSSSLLLPIVKVMPNTKKFCYNGITPELEKKLDLMFSPSEKPCDNCGDIHAHFHDLAELFPIGGKVFFFQQRDLKNIYVCDQLKLDSVLRCNV
ncbi:hypothetical protein IEQ34_006553 [Dendrobium chrysotoxum]|uniref:Uncharacterized protein n=1 Tax=Dendrobium chrysotoxum TaxID=161865 RepID=A0AAV7H4A9_DENCH|nr:hypothetical protein IEQ34_006553 [Dendrobium chrysotoxum]